MMVEMYPGLYFDFHAHNDYDLAVGNVFSAISAGVTGIHTTINGLGERAGNAPLASVIAILHDQLNVKTNIIENNLNRVSRIVESYSGLRIPNNKPVIGDSVFTQCAGIHADGDNKNNLYYNNLLPERFDRAREYALGKTSGKANIKKNLEEMGIELDEASMKKITDRIIELGDKKEIVTQDDLPYIISDVLHTQSTEKIKMVNYSLSLTHSLRPTATVRIEIEGKEYEQTAPGDGQYNAFSKALWKIYSQLEKPKPALADYNVSIPAGGRTDALVQTTIVWSFKGKKFKTRGLDVDQTEAAIKATVKMLNISENM
jgi:D-citramalate synthase